MRNTIGLITLLLMSQSIYAEDMQTAPTEATSPATEMAAPAVDAEPAATEMPAAMTETPAEMKEQSGFSRGSVVRSAFTTEIAEREPTQDLKTLSNDNDKVMFFTELRDMNGQTAVHRWEHDGKVVAEIEFKVNGPRWRVWSSKNLTPENTGDWKVSVLNGAGEVISEKNLDYEVAAMPAKESQMDNTAPAVSPESAQ
jgi:hypothetical protein